MCIVKIFVSPSSDPFLAIERSSVRGPLIEKVKEMLKSHQKFRVERVRLSVSGAAHILTKVAGMVPCPSRLFWEHCSFGAARTF